MRFIIVALILSGCDGASVFGYNSSTLVRDPKFEVFSGRGPFLILESGNFIISSPASVDYVASMENLANENAIKDNKKIFVFRSANYIRQDLYQYGLNKTIISDLKTGVSFTFSGKQNNRKSLIIYGSAKAEPVNIYKTNKHDRVLGENCDIWSFDNPPIYSDKCLTSDGIVLWQKEFGSGGKIDQFYRAISLVRRPVRSKEIFPSALQSWESWINTDSKPDPLPNDKVVLEGKQGWQKTSWKMLVIKRLGKDIVDKDVYPLGSRRNIDWQGAHIFFEEDRHGNPIKMSIWRIQPSKNTSISQSWDSAITRSETVLNYKCEWRVSIPGSEGDYEECRSANGILLKSSNRYISDITELTARSVSIGKLTEQDLQPPGLWLKLGFWTNPLIETQRARP